MSSFDFEGLFLSNYEYCYCQGDLDLSSGNLNHHVLIVESPETRVRITQSRDDRREWQLWFQRIKSRPPGWENVHPMYFSPGPVQSCSFFLSANWVLLEGLHGFSTPRLSVHQPRCIFPCIPVQLWLFDSVNRALFSERKRGISKKASWGLVPRVAQCVIPVGIPTINYSE